jgi:hypothetical protein
MDDTIGSQIMGTSVQAVLAEEAHKAVLAATRSFLQRVDVKGLDELRKDFELPPEALGALIEIHAKKLAESETTKLALCVSRQVLPISTGAVLVKPGQIAEIIARPQRVAFRPERVFVSDAASEYKGPWWKRLSPWYTAPQPKGASDWIIHDIVIGNRSQFSQTGVIPADMFRSTAIDNFVSFETAQIAVDVKFVVEYIGPNHKGERFYASMIGTAAV